LLPRHLGVELVLAPPLEPLVIAMPTAGIRSSPGVKNPLVSVVRSQCSPQAISQQCPQMPGPGRPRRGFGRSPPWRAATAASSLSRPQSSSAFSRRTAVS